MGKILRAVIGATVIIASLSVSANAKDKEEPNALTHGMVQMTLKVGQTTQAEIIENFGGPNITTIDGSGQEMWVYDRHATVSYDKQSGFSIGLFAGGGGGGVEPVLEAAVYQDAFEKINQAVFIRNNMTETSPEKPVAQEVNNGTAD